MTLTIQKRTLGCSYCPKHPNLPRPAKSFPKSFRLSKKVSLYLLAGSLSIVSGLFIATNRLHAPVSKSQLLPSAVYYHRVKKGMTQEEVESSCGRPEYAQQMSNLGDDAEAWYYSASDGQVQIDFDNGVVKYISRE